MLRLGLPYRGASRYGNAYSFANPSAKLHANALPHSYGITESCAHGDAFAKPHGLANPHSGSHTCAVGGGPIHSP